MCIGELVSVGYRYELELKTTLSRGRKRLTALYIIRLEGGNQTSFSNKINDALACKQTGSARSHDFLSELPQSVYMSQMGMSEAYSFGNDGVAYPQRPGGYPKLLRKGSGCFDEVEASIRAKYQAAGWVQGLGWVAQCSNAPIAPTSCLGHPSILGSPDQYYSNFIRYHRLRWNASHQSSLGEIVLGLIKN